MGDHQISYSMRYWCKSVVYSVFTMELAMMHLWESPQEDLKHIPPGKPNSALNRLSTYYFFGGTSRDPRFIYFFGFILGARIGQI